MANQTINRSGRSHNYTLPAPTGGLNVRDGLDTMSETDAIVMDNYYPSETKVCLRGGYRAYALNDDKVKVETLIEFRHADGDRLFACGNGKIWDVSTPADIREVSSDHQYNNWQYVQFKDRILACNGYDKPLSWQKDEEGEWVWKEAEFTGSGLDPQKLINVAMSKQRLFFVEHNSLKCWYSESAGEVQGTLMELDFSALVTRGGCLQAVAGWTQDCWQGIDDLTLFITSEGEVLVYAGSDPSNADDWSLKGKYYVSRPIGYRCTFQYRGDVVMISEDGYVPLSQVMPLAQGGTAGLAYSDKIRGLVLERVRDNKTLPGWQGIIYPRGGYALFNVPVRKQFEQHVINLSSGAWCRFTNILSLCWGLLSGRLYFGSETGVYLFDEGYSDNGLHILGNIHQAYSDFGCGNLKKVQMINPRTKSSTRFALNIYVNTDFDDSEQGYQENIGNTGLTKWAGGGVSTKWSSLGMPKGTKWATLKGAVYNRWICCSASGFKCSVVFKTKTRGNLIEWHNTGIRYEQGGGIL